MADARLSVVALLALSAVWANLEGDVKGELRLRLEAFRGLCEQAAGRMCVGCTPQSYDLFKPTRGVLFAHCNAVSVAICPRFGGRILQGYVGTLLYNEGHWWNQLPDGREVDLTSSQFGADGLHRLANAHAQGYADIDDLPGILEEYPFIGIFLARLEAAEQRAAGQLEIWEAA